MIYFQSFVVCRNAKKKTGNIVSSPMKNVKHQDVKLIKIGNHFLYTIRIQSRNIRNILSVQIF